MRTQYPYLIRSKHQIYHFRIIVPEPLRTAVGLREIRRSLRTRELRQALARSGEMLSSIKTLFEQVQQGQLVTMNCLQLSWEEGAKPSGSRVMPGGFQAADAGAYSSPQLSVVFDQYAAQQRLEGVSEKTVCDKRAMVELFIWIIGDKPVAMIGREQVQRFRETALKLPPGFNRYRHQPLQEVLASADKTISLTTYNNYIKYLGTVFAYAVSQGHCQSNPFAGQKVRQRKKASSHRARYSHQELQRIFSSDLYTQSRNGPAWHYWLPLLGLYTGARLNEICQLYLDDVVQVEGIDCFHIRAQHPDQKLKNLASERLIPIHSQLQALGLMAYVKRQREAGQQRLFPELSWNPRNGYGHSASKWFARLRDRLGLNQPGEKKDFHSFRHTVADELKQRGLPESQIAGLLGHQGGGITFGRYGKDYRPAMLRSIVEALVIEGLWNA